MQRKLSTFVNTLWNKFSNIVALRCPISRLVRLWNQYFSMRITLIDFYEEKKKKTLFNKDGLRHRVWRLASQRLFCVFSLIWISNHKLKQNARFFGSSCKMRKYLHVMLSYEKYSNIVPKTEIKHINIYFYM